MKQNRKTTVTVVVVLIASFVVCCLGIPLGCVYFSSSGFAVGPSYTMVANGDRLLVREVVSQKEFVLEEGRPSGVDIHWDGKEIVIKDRISENRQKMALVNDEFWSPKHEAVYFFNRVYDEDSTELWQWTPGKNYERLHVFNHDVKNLRESLDGKYLTGTYYEFGDVRECGVVTYDIAGHETKVIKSNEQIREVVMLGPDRFFLVVGNPAEIWTPSTNKVVLTQAKGDLHQLMVFRGELWALKLENEKFQIVKFAPDGMSFAKVVDFPADFPKVTLADQKGD